MACEQTCELCRWSRRAERSEEVLPPVEACHPGVTVRRTRLECRAEPPRLGGWPPVKPSDWCGAWEARL